MAYSDDRLSPIDVTGQSWSAVFRNLPALLAIGFLLVGLPSLVIAKLEQAVAHPVVSQVTGLVSFVLFLAFSACVSRPVFNFVIGGAADDLRSFWRNGLSGARRGVPAAVMATGATMAPMLALGLLGWIAQAAGLEPRSTHGLGWVALLVAIAAFVATAWIAMALFVVVPAAVIENRGPFDAMRRSREMTSGNRLRAASAVLLLVLSTILPSWLLSLLVIGPSPSQMLGTFGAILAVDLTSPQLWLLSLINLFVTSLFVVAPVAAYGRLRGQHADLPGAVAQAG